MFGIGAGELMLLMVLALIVVGPQKLPEMGRTVGKAIGEFRSQADAFKGMMSLDPQTPVAVRTQAAAPVEVPAETVDERVSGLQDFSDYRQREIALMRTPELEVTTEKDAATDKVVV